MFKKIYKIGKLTKFFRGHYYIYPKILRIVIRKRLGWRYPAIVDIAVTSDCNYKCKHCYASEFQNLDTKQSLSFEEIKQIIDDACSLGVIMITLTGGESLLRKDIFDIIDYIKREKKMLVQLTSNGYFLNSEIIRKLKLSGLFNLNVSINGIGISHDEFCGMPGAYERAIAAIKMSLEEGLFTKFQLVARKESIRSGEFQAIIDIVNKCKASSKINFPMLSRRYSDPETVLLAKQEREYIRDLAKKDNVILDTANSMRSEYCPMVDSSIFIAPNGEVFPCAFIQIAFGNIKKEALRDVLKKMQGSVFFKNPYKCCPAGESMNFIKKYILPCLEHNKGVIYYKSHPLFSEEKQNII